MNPNDDNPGNPPPIPNLPPPLPSRASVSGAGKAGDSKRRAVLLSVAGIGCGGLLLVGVIVAFTVIFTTTAKDFELTEAQENCVVTIEDLGEWFEIEINPAGETWESERYFDRSVQIYYTYEDLADESIQLNCNLTIERKRSDALMMYGMEWGGLKLTNRLAGEDSIELELSNDTFRWGDESKFAFQSIDGERYGFVFLARKGTKVFFIDCWGLLLEEPEDISQLLTSHLEQFAAESFRSP